jgi:hypothetical protein
LGVIHATDEGYHVSIAQSVTKPIGKCSPTVFLAVATGEGEGEELRPYALTFEDIEALDQRPELFAYQPENLLAAVAVVADPSSVRNRVMTVERLRTA